MENKVQMAVLRAIKRNQFIADQPIHVKAKGRKVVLLGEVGREDLVFEAIATAESVHPMLQVRSKLTVNTSKTTAV